MNKGKNIDLTLKELSRKREYPKSLFILLLLLYAICYVNTVRVARSPDSVLIMGNDIPLATFAGVITSLANIFIISLVVFFGKVGYFTGLAIILGQFPMMMVNLIITISTSPAMVAEILY